MFLNQPLRAKNKILSKDMNIMMEINADRRN